MKHFKVEEICTRKQFEDYGELVLNFMDFNILNVADKVREISGKRIIINDWCFGGTMEYSGLRPQVCSVGVLNSQHKYGRALDLHIEGMSGFDMFKMICENAKILMPLGLTSIEAHCLTWAHIDSRYTGLDNLFIFDNPGLR